MGDYLKKWNCVAHLEFLELTEEEENHFSDLSNNGLLDTVFNAKKKIIRFHIDPNKK